MNILDIPSAEQLLNIREVIKNPSQRTFTEEQKYIMYQGFNEIQKLHRLGQMKQGCASCLHLTIIPALKRWFAEWDRVNSSSLAPFKIDMNHVAKSIDDDLKLSIRDSLRKQLDERGIKYHHKHGVKKLIELLNGEA